MNLIQDTIIVSVRRPKLLRELAQKLFMLSELKVKHGFQEHCKFKLVLWCIILNCLLLNLISSHFFSYYISDTGTSGGLYSWPNNRTCSYHYHFLLHAILRFLAIISIVWVLHKCLVSLHVNAIFYLRLKLLEIFFIIHFLNDLFPLPFFNRVSCYLFLKFEQVILTLRWVSLFQHCFQKCINCLLNSMLYETEFFVALIP